MGIYTQPNSTWSKTHQSISLSAETSTQMKSPRTELKFCLITDEVRGGVNHVKVLLYRNKEG